ncbi:MAG: ribonucleoside-diphosphate reductase subunit alpha [Candidatus Omnitrophica bacterium]|nr:ribonucleoside-diphosphate reductase subunit alpha [Candidatus Omnitrophota bacterium]
MPQTSTGSKEIKVQKRNGQLVAFNLSRIAQAIGNAFKEAHQIPREADLNSDISAQVAKVTQCVTEVLKERAAKKDTLAVEEIQDEVVRQLQENGFREIAERYGDYRRQHTARRAIFELYKTVKRDGKVVSFKPEKITSAIAKAFRAAAKQELTESELGQARKLSEKVVTEIRSSWPQGASVHIEEIQDIVEKTLMTSGYYEVAKRFIVYREIRRKERQAKGVSQEVSLDWAKKIMIKTSDGQSKPLDVEELRFQIQSCCEGLAEVSAEKILKESLKNYYNDITEKQMALSDIMAARSFIEVEPNYSFVAARLLLLESYREAFGEPVSFDQVKAEYPGYLGRYVKKAVELELLNPELLGFDLEYLGGQLAPERDLLFKYMGLQTLYDRYFIHWEERRLEIPQVFWMRVAMGLAKSEGEHRNEKAVEFYNLLSSFRFISSTPTLFNSGSMHSQLSSCFLTTVGDDLFHIFKCIQDNAMLSKWSGGLGNDWTNVRAMGSRIKGTNGKSQGVIPFLKVANDTAVAVNQGGKRQGATCAYLETWHMDIEEFLELRKNTGDDRRRTHDMHTANWIPDLFMKRVKADKDWTLFSPSEALDLHHLYGQAFERRYEEYEAMAKEGKVRKFKVVSAVQLWRKMLTMLFETGHPWITWKDPSNVRSPQDHTGVVHSSNLCTEILLNTSKEETAVCNLGSVNLAAHTTSRGLDHDLLKETVTTAVRMLDNVIDINFYPTAEARNSNLRHRPVGLGIMGFQDALYVQNMSYASPQAVEFADRSMEAVSYYAIFGSIELAKERGAYSSYAGSKWSRGLLPMDTVDLLEKERGGFLKVDRSSRMDWAPVREALKKYGIRNSNVMAIAPTATIANIVGVGSSIEPTYKNIFVKSNLSGEFTVPNEFLVEDLKKLGLWDKEMIDDLKYFDGSVQEIGRVPQEIKMKYPTVFEVDYEWVIESASRRQKWIDMGQSLNLYQAQPNGKKLNDMYMFGWERGLKTTYYLRSLGATRIEKSTLDANRYGNSIGQKSKEEKLVDPSALSKEQCSLINKENCEACQ